MTPTELKTLSDDVLLACTEGCPPGGEAAVKRVCNPDSGQFKKSTTIKLAKAASILLEQLNWHTKRAFQLRALSTTIRNAIDFAEVHEAAADQLRIALEAIKS
jgi:hypothetical protein